LKQQNAAFNEMRSDEIQGIGMFLESKDIPDLQRLVQEPRNGGIAKIKDADVSLSVVLYLAVTHRTLWLAGKTSAASSIARLGLPGVSRAINCLLATKPTPSRSPLGAPPFDLYRIGSKQDLRCDQWLLFCDRFRRSAERGRNGKMYVGVAAVLGEMGDNVVWHAFEAPDKPCPAIAGFHVANGSASFCVADAGQGFLRSLQRSTRWAGLKNDHDALNAVVAKRATSRANESEGGGFKQLFNSLLDFNGLVVLRTGTSSFHMSNQRAERELRADNSTHVPGSAVTTVISTAGQPKELALEKNT
jgi:hypothetical protein